MAPFRFSRAENVLGERCCKFQVNSFRRQPILFQGDQPKLGRLGNSALPFGCGSFFCNLGNGSFEAYRSTLPPTFGPRRGFD
jgi:hypothetical protein